MMAVTMTSARGATRETQAPSCASLAVEILSGLAAAEELWRAFEQAADASPYQRFDWVSAFVTSTDSAKDVRVAVLRDASGAVAAILPFVLTRRFGARIATAPGGKHANYNLPLTTAGFAFDPAALLRDIGRRVRADAVTIRHVPVQWNGHPGPLAGLGRPSASPAYRLDLDGDSDAALSRAMSNDARKKLRAKERGLAKLGEIALIEAHHPVEAERILDAFFAQKHKRFRELGIPDPYGEAWAQDFLRAAAGAGLAEGRPALELYALTLDGEVVATLGGAADRNRLSGMFISFDGEAEAARFSPGDVLVTRVVREQSGRGRRTFDLGVGDARYKRSMCDGVDHLVDVTVAVTLRGAAFSFVGRVAGDIKRRIKADPRATRIVARLRAAKAKFGR